MPRNYEAIKAAQVLIEHGYDREALSVLKSCNEDANADYYLALGTCYRNLGDFPNAKNCFDTGMGFDPTHAQLRFARALLLLTIGRFDDGWKEYEIRKANAPGEVRGFDYPEWDGGACENLLIYGEQGLGDEIMFLQCALDLPEPACFAHRIIECAPTLVNLLAENFSWIEIKPRNNARDPRLYEFPLSNNTVQISAASLPLLLQRLKVSVFRPGKYLKALPIVFGKLQRPLIGISWQGGTHLTRRAARSLPLHIFLSRVRDLFPGAMFISLQYDDAPKDEPDFFVPSFNDAHGDMLQTARHIAACDLIVSVCNTTVHLAGALGKPCYVLAPFVPEWRYGLNPTMPWYESVRIFRQKSPGDWRGAWDAMQQYHADKRNPEISY